MICYMFCLYYNSSFGVINNQIANAMKTYLIERNVPGAGKLTPDQLKAISQKSNNVLNCMGPNIEWVKSYVTSDKFFCIYKARNEELIKQHAAMGDFPANVITEVVAEISPATADN